MWKVRGKEGVKWGHGVQEVQGVKEVKGVNEVDVILRMREVAARVRGRNVGLYVRMAFIPLRKYKIILYGMALCWGIRQQSYMVNVGGSAQRCRISRNGVGRPSGLQSLVAGDVNPRDAGRPVRWVAARGWCAPEHGTRRREKGARDSGE